ncbi:FecCD family ABC transporter permease [Fervidibacillus albus]|uniref:Iron ABC transporter permease n=1 Tax=Fervidibacillus albus TaxID=2980026 RepID=A0A9E8LTP5_9BACI|nr:iron ABC transporter permease [Fervidibacillus albus]WAA09185.1 iron ABC transporter permease [Fervidibacillus albus]
MHKPVGRFLVAIFGLIVFLILSFYLHITNGMFDISFSEVFKTLFGFETNETFRLVIFDFRLPRIVIASLIGVALAISGVVLQGITKNGLADPGILGINSGAGAAVVIFMYFFQFQAVRTDGSDIVNILMMPVFGFVGGTLAALLIFTFSYKNGYLDVQRLILTGIAINSGFGAISLYISLKMNEKDFESAAIWQAGSIYNANWTFIIAMLPWIIILGFYIYRKAYILDYFLLEENEIISLGIPLEREKNLLLLASVGLVSASVSVSGNIGFIGLMAPHIARQLVGISNRFVMPASAFIGAGLLIFSDFLAKTVFAPSELAVGIVVSIIGIPYFLYLLIKEK